MTNPHTSSLVTCQREQAAKISQLCLTWGFVGSVILHLLGLGVLVANLARSPILDSATDLEEAVTVDMVVEPSPEEFTEPAIEKAATDGGDALPGEGGTAIALAPNLGDETPKGSQSGLLPEQPPATPTPNPLTENPIENSVVTPTPSPSPTPQPETQSQPIVTSSPAPSRVLPPQGRFPWSGLFKPRHQPVGAVESGLTANSNPSSKNSGGLAVGQNPGNLGRGQGSTPGIGASDGTIGTGSSPSPGLGNGANSGSNDRPSNSPRRSHRPNCLSCPKPQNVRDAQGRPIEGTARVIYDVDQNGHVINLRLRQSSGNSEIDRATLDAISQWRFEPSETGRRGMQRRVDFVEEGSAFHRQVETRNQLAEQQRRDAEQAERRRQTVEQQIGDRSSPSPASQSPSADPTQPIPQTPKPIAPVPINPPSTTPKPESAQENSVPIPNESPAPDVLPTNPVPSPVSNPLPPPLPEPIAPAAPPPEPPPAAEPVVPPVADSPNSPASQ